MGNRGKDCTITEYFFLFMHHRKNRKKRRRRSWPSCHPYRVNSGREGRKRWLLIKAVDIFCTVQLLQFSASKVIKCPRTRNMWVLMHEDKRCTSCHHHHHHQISLNHKGLWDTTDDFTASFFHDSLFSTALWDLPNIRPVRSLMLSFHLFLSLLCLLPPFTAVSYTHLTLPTTELV